MDMLKDLCTLNGISGDEDDVRRYILEKISGHSSGRVDKLGNIIVFKKGKKTPAKKILFEAHMDETGYMVKSIDDDGYVYFDSVGVPPNVTPGKTVIIRGTADGVKNIRGVIGLVPVHLLKKQEEYGEIPKIKEMCIDIGAKSKDDAKKYIIEGDSIHFESEYGKIGDLLKGKAFDDRAGCYNLIRMITSELEYDAWFAFCVQEEVGLRGAKTAAYAVQPDYAVILEGTTAGDVGATEDEKAVCKVGQGVAISFADRGTLYSSELVARTVNTAKERNIPYQYKAFVSGGCDAASWQRSGVGADVITLSVPTRYLHTRLSCVSEKDIESQYALANAMLEELGKEE